MSGDKHVLRSELRNEFRHRRRGLNASAQQTASQAVLNHLIEANLLNVRRIAAYLPNDGEVSLQIVIEYAWRKGIDVFLPVLHPFSPGHLLFCHFTPSSHMQPNRFGIPEPVIEVQDICPLASLDCIFTPLVAFDAHGNRMGMGGGFYDRTLAPIRRDGLNCQLIGVAHSCQQAGLLPVQSWDIPLDKIVTEQQIYSL